MNQPCGPKYYFTVIFAISILFMGSLAVHCQLSQPGRPYLLEYTGSPVLKVYEIVVAEEQKARALAKDGESMLKPAKSGLLIDVFYSPEYSGTWDTLSDGMKIWRAAFHIKGASMLNIVFSPYHLNKGVRVFLYDRKQQNILGAFTDVNNKPFNSLGTAQIPGDFLVVEIQVPKYMKSLGSIGISNIGCDFSADETSGSLKDGWFGKSGNCNVDISCINDSLVQILKNAVVRIVFRGTERCTGTLVNNTMKDGSNYVLTAEHCINREIDANTAVFYFDYESPYCNGPDGSNSKALSGSTIRATGEQLDFTLLELFEPVPFTFQPFYAGWNYLGYTPTSGFIIHHPYGDVKKISEENHPLSAGAFGQDYTDNTHWLVNRWDLGTTEIGSSGGAFFDQRGLVVGTLTGGLANCTSPVNDYFQMFSHSWDDYPDEGKQLACWLDPLKLRNGYIEGYDPYLKVKLTGDTLSNIGDHELLVTESGSLAWGSYSGHNSMFITGFSEKYTVTEKKSMLGLLLRISQNDVANEQAMVRVKVWNGVNTPATTLYEKEVFLSDLFIDTLSFIEFDSVVSVSQTFFAGYEVAYNTPQDTFSTFMAANRITEPLVNTAYVYNGTQWQSLADFTGGTISSSYAVFPVVFDSIPGQSPAPEFNDRIIAYPNPAGSQIYLEFREMTALPVNITFFNMQGQTVLQRNYGPYQRLIPLELKLSPGIYLIKVNEGQILHTLKVAVIK